jgi:hypothetical protein
MFELRSVPRILISMFVAFVGTLSVFGLVLSPLWGIAGGIPAFEAIIAALSATVAIVSGGAIAQLLTRSETPIAAEAFSYMFGGMTAIYILGGDPLVVPVVLLTALLGGTGGILAIRMTRSWSAWSGGPA